MVGFDTFTSRLLVMGQLEATTPLRIGAGKSSDATESDQPVLKDIFGRPLIPGSSLKGALRSHIESILRAVEFTRPEAERRTLVCDVLDDENICIPRSVGDPLRRDTRNGDAALIERSCMTCRLFGSPYVAAKLAIQDLAVDLDSWGDRYMLRDGVAINRDTGTADDGKKYDLEAVPAGTRFQFTMQVDNASEEELGLTFLAVDALVNERVQIGGARSRGLGWCKLMAPMYELHTDPIDYLLGDNEAAQADETTRNAYISSFKTLIGRSHA